MSDGQMLWLVLMLAWQAACLWRISYLLERMWRKETNVLHVNVAWPDKKKRRQR